MRKPTDGATGVASPGPAGAAVLEVRDPADQRCVVAEVPGFRDAGSAFKEQGAPGLRFYTGLKTAAVRFTW